MAHERDEETEPNKTPTVVLYTGPDNETYLVPPSAWSNFDQTKPLNVENAHQVATFEPNESGQDTLTRVP